MNEIQKHNQDPSKTWKKGVNQFTDRTHEEFRKLLGYRPKTQFKEFKATYEGPILKDLPPTVDWRTKHIITAVKDQGACGSCWSFGTAETLESYYALKTGKLVVLSEQQILDCTPNPRDGGGTGGCGGGTTEIAYNQIIQMGGLSSEASYPYISGGGQDFTCHFNKSDVVAKISGFTSLPSNQYAPIMTVLATIGPLAINVDASSWASYDSGVFDGCSQTNVDIDHVVQLVGYGTDPNYGPYWLIRNSWSESYGEDGYIRVKRSENAGCGMDSKPQDGTGCNGGPSEIQVCGECGLWFDTNFVAISN
jgi:cathepsin L